MKPVRYEELFFNKKDIEKITGKAPCTITLWVTKGCPTEGKRGRELWFYLPDVWKWFEIDKLGYDPSHPHMEKARLDKARANNEELKFKEKTGQVIPIEDVVKVVGQWVYNCKAKLIALPTKASPLLLGCTTLPELTKALKELIYECSDELKDVDKYFRENSSKLDITAEPQAERMGRQGKKAK